MFAVKDDVFGEKGYSTELKMMAWELDYLRNMVRNHFNSIIKEKYPDHAWRFKETPFDEYHTLCHTIDHAKTWTKKTRILPTEKVNDIKALPFMKQLADVFGQFRITSEENVNPEEVYWRIVRPNESGDVGTIHADRWFWDLGHGEKPGKRCVKIWIPLYVEPGLSGLAMVPGSHLKTDWKYHGEKPAHDYRDYFLKPVIDEDVSKLDVQILKTEPGTIVAFNDLTLHGGLVGKGEKTRISMEFMLYNDDDN